MKKLLMLIAPVLIVLVAFRPVKSYTISGTVTDATGQPVARASVMVKGTTIGTSTDFKGFFKLSVPDNGKTLIISAVGFDTKEISINGKTSVSITLVATTKSMQEVVVMGYAPVKKMSVTGSASSLYGSVPGVQVSQANGDMQYYYKKDEPGLYGDFDREGYDKITENKFLKATDNPLSTFSIDVDAASYSNVRRFLNQGQLPPAGAVRIEEMVNYFKYEYPQPGNKEPFTVNTEISDAPWNPEHKLVLIGLQGKQIPVENLPASNLVFLIDVSGSMQDPNKLPLVKASMKLLVDQLREEDKVAMVVYAGAAGLVLPSTSGHEKAKIKDAIDRLDAGGSTAGGAGIKLAYKTARENFAKGGNNRVILCTDGDFNVGESSDDAMERLIEQERKSGVFLTVLGYGMGNYQDAKMQKLADKGNGNHAYIDGISEAKKVLVNEFGGTLFTIAKDVKLQIEFNPAKVQGYRLIGYENRMLAKEDFNDDKKDAGELGSGHTVTALYEIIPAGVESDFLKDVDKLKYQKDVEPLSKTKYNDEIMTVKLRYKAPDGDVSKLIEHPVKDEHIVIAKTSDNFRFAAAVAQFGLLLRDSEFKSEASYASVISLAKKAKGNDDEGYRSEFIRLVESARLLAKTKPAAEEDEETISKK
ncbi:MAG TPA: von Willebrand factor type A domain-containing protein [Chitinophagaceae bacterium]|jgi:Ca-activated chloride channel family protein|nr:von Willebrand factor type A domain-containing protein [Chitinophagaceae bacterium]HMU57480.1 von Willebrand factor type A domain-containing protein [Chitinophagaceae bacterium]